MQELPPFIPGLELAEGLYREAIEPMLRRERPGLAYSAGLIGSGSEILGRDDERSRDHNWGPRTDLFLSAHDYPREADALRSLLRGHLPAMFRGYSVHCGPPNLEDNGTRAMEVGRPGEVDSLATVGTWEGFLGNLLGKRRSASPELLDWLTFPEQALLELTGGRVFHDGLGTLEPTRRRFAYYPDDIWLHRLAAQWQLLSEEEAFVGRTAQVGDELGSRIVAARIARNAMRLGFLMERRYAPYLKWLGTAFRELACGASLGDPLEAALAAASYPERERALCRAYEELARMHNGLGITERLDENVRGYFTRPFRVIGGGRFEAAIRERIQNEQIRALPALLGATDQLVDVSSALSPILTGRMRRIYD